MAFRRIGLLAFFASSTLLAATAISARSPGDWRLENSVEARYPYNAARGGAEVWPEGHLTDGFVQVAPDRKHFFVGTRRGDLACDCARYTLAVYSIDQVRKALAAGRRLDAGLPPLRSVVMSSALSGGFAAIRRATWESSSTVLFTGYGPEGNTGLYRLDVISGDVSRLFEISEPEGALWSYSLRDKSFVYVVARKLEMGRPPRHYPSWPLQGDVREWLSGEAQAPHRMEVFSRFSKEPARLALSYPQPRKSLPVPREPQMSPDGQWAVVIAPAYEEPGSEHESPVLPAQWEQYEGLEVPRTVLDAAGYQRLWRYVLVNVRDGSTRVMVDAPRGPPGTAPAVGTPPVLWSSDSTRVVLVNVGLPLDTDDTQRRSMGYLVDYDVRSGEWSVLEPMAEEREIVFAAGSISITAADGFTRKVQNVGWVDEGRAFLVTYVTLDGKATDGTVYRLNEHGWRGRAAEPGQKLPGVAEPASSDLAGGLKLVLREGQNDPPELLAIEGKRELSLLGPDPALAGVWRASPQPVRWNERNGHVEDGVLLLPRSAPRAQALPLVIQLEVYPEGLFRPDGVASTAFASQALVAQGMAVLRMDALVSSDYPEVDPQLWVRGEQTQPMWLEPLLVRERVDAAVKKLASDGVIDAKRVGLLGFSRTGFYASYIITHPEGLNPSAAIIADATTSSYGEYLHSEAYFGQGAEQTFSSVNMSWLYGGTFWQNKRTWVEQAPFFNVEKVDTPVLFTFNGVTPSNGATPVMEILAAFRLNDREVDVHLFPEGVHQLRRPRERLKSLQLTVDWMNFWLQGRERTGDAETAKQYRHWRSLREHRDARRSKEKR